MGDKKNEMKFTILFSPANPDHILAANKLNTQSRNNKANYVAQAIKFFEENNHLDKDFITRTVRDILDKRNILTQTDVQTEKGISEDLDEQLKEKINNSLQIFKRKSL